MRFFDCDIGKVWLSIYISWRKRMIKIRKLSSYNLESLKSVAGDYLEFIAVAANVEVARERLHRKINTNQFDSFAGESTLYEGRIVRVRDCAIALKSILKVRSDKLAGFSTVEALYDIARGVPRPDLMPGFWSEMYHLFTGLKGIGPGTAPGDFLLPKKLTGREAAIARSEELDKLWDSVEYRMAKYRHGLEKEIIEYRQNRT